MKDILFNAKDGIFGFVIGSIGAIFSGLADWVGPLTAVVLLLTIFKMIDGYMEKEFKISLLKFIIRSTKAFLRR